MLYYQYQVTHLTIEYLLWHNKIVFAFLWFGDNNKMLLELHFAENAFALKLFL